MIRLIIKQLNISHWLFFLGMPSTYFFILNNRPEIMDYREEHKTLEEQRYGWNKRGKEFCQVVLWTSTTLSLIIHSYLFYNAFLEGILEIMIVFGMYMMFSTTAIFYANLIITIILFDIGCFIKEIAVVKKYNDTSVLDYSKLPYYYKQKEKNNVTQWLRKNRLHRLDGPALVSKHCKPEYFIKGKKYLDASSYCIGLVEYGLSKELATKVRLENE